MSFKQKSFNRSEKLLCGCRRQGGVQYIRKNPNSNIKSVSDTQVISNFPLDENDKGSFQIQSLGIKKLSFTNLFLNSVLQIRRLAEHIYEQTHYCVSYIKSSIK